MKLLYNFCNTGSNYLSFTSGTFSESSWLTWTRLGLGLFYRLSSVGLCVHHLSCLSFVEKGVEWLGVIPSVRGGKVCHVDIEAVTLSGGEIL